MMIITFVFQILLITFTILMTWILLLKIVRHFWKFPIPAILTDLIDNPIRRKVQPPKKLVDIMQLKPDMIILEVGSGKGTYTFEVAKRVPDGKVITIDIQERVVKKLKKKCEESGITNVEPKIMDVYNLNFDNEVFDRVFLISCLPEIPDPIRALKELKRVLKSNGLLCLVETFPDPDYPLPKTEIKWTKDAGFTLDSRHGNLFIYYLIFSKSN